MNENIATNFEPRDSRMIHDHSSTDEIMNGVNPCEHSSQRGAMEPNILGPDATRKENNHVGCQSDLENQELLGLQKKSRDEMAQKAVLEQQLEELRVEYANQLKRNTLLSEQLNCMTEQVNSSAEAIQDLEIECDTLKRDNEFLRDENGKLLRCKNVDKESLQGDDDKTMFFTGIPSFKLLEVIYEFVEVGVPYSYIHPPIHVVPKFTELLITLMRLRLGVLERDLAYRFNLPLSSISDICSRWITVMSSRLESLIAWPDRTVLQRTVPQTFKTVFGDRIAVIIDCFEVFINLPSSVSPRAEAFSKYRHRNTAKFLIGFTPLGTVCFVSKAWEGSASDKHIMMHSGFLDNLATGDVVLADRVLDIDEEIGMRQAKFPIPAFTKGETQLSFDDVTKTREIEIIRINVERVTGFIRSKFRILGSTLPYRYLMPPSDTEDDTPLIDDIMKTCCALMNMCPSIIRNPGPSGDLTHDDLLVQKVVFGDEVEDNKIL